MIRESQIQSTSQNKVYSIIAQPLNSGWTLSVPVFNVKWANIVYSNMVFGDNRSFSGPYFMNGDGSPQYTLKYFSTKEKEFNSNSLMLYLNGQLLTRNEDYTESGDNSFILDKKRFRRGYPSNRDHMAIVFSPKINIEPMISGIVIKEIKDNEIIIEFTGVEWDGEKKVQLHILCG